MRLTLDDLKVAESAARAWPQGHYGPYAGKLPCVLVAITDFNGGCHDPAWSLVGMIESMHRGKGPSDIYQLPHRVIQGMLVANPTYLADCIKQVIDAAEYQPTVKKEVTALRTPARTAAPTAILRESNVQRATSGLASSQPESPRTAEAATT